MKIQYQKLGNSVGCPMVWRSIHPMSLDIANKELKRMKEKHKGLKIFLSNHHTLLVMETYEEEVCYVRVEICDNLPEDRMASEAEFILKESYES